MWSQLGSIFHGGERAELLMRNVRSALQALKCIDTKSAQLYVNLKAAASSARALKDIPAQLQHSKGQK